MHRSVLRLHPVPPFRLDLTVWALRRRAENTWDRWDGRTYRRVLALPGGPVEVAVTQSGTPEDPFVEVTAAGGTSAAVGPEAAAALDALLGLRTDLSGLYDLA